MNITRTQLVLVPIVAALTAAASGRAVTEIIDATGDGAGNPLSGAGDVAVDDFGNVFVAGRESDNVFSISPQGLITEIIDSSGDGLHALASPDSVATDGLGNVYVAGHDSDNVFMIAPGGTVTEILDSTGDGMGNELDGPTDLATDESGNVYVAGGESDNVLMITPEGTVTEIIDATGDGAENLLDWPTGVAVDGSGNVYVVGRVNAFRIAPGGTITKIIDRMNVPIPIFFPGTIAVSDSGNVYVGDKWLIIDWWFGGLVVGTVYKITPDGVITAIYDRRTDAIAVDGAENLFVTAHCSAGLPCSRARKVAPDGETTEILDSDADGVHSCGDVSGIATDTSGTVYATSGESNNAFKITATCPGDINGDDAVDALDFLLLIAQWGTPCGGSCEADITGPAGAPDGSVDALDYLMLVAHWGSPANCLTP